MPPNNCMGNEDEPALTSTVGLSRNDQHSRAALEKNRRNDILLRNRMKLCAFSIFLMWSSSLRTSMYISSFAIDVPLAQILYKSCKASMHIILEEKERFSSCVDRQMKKCEDDLKTAIGLETQRVNAMSSHNTKGVNRVRKSAENCSEDFTLLKRSLEEWLALSQTLPIRNTTCSPRDREVMMSTVYDVNVLRSEALAVSTRYSRESRNTMHNIVDYAKIRSEYDVNYAKKHMDVVSNEVQKYISLTPIPDLKVKDELDKIQRHVDNLLSCTTLNTDVCEFPSLDLGLSEMWNEYKYETRQKWVELENYWDTGCNELIQKSNDFADEAFAAYLKFNDFRNTAITWYKNPPCSACGFWINEIKASLDTGEAVWGDLGRAFPDEILAAYRNFIYFNMTVQRPLTFSLDESIQNFKQNANILNAKINAIYADSIWPKIESAYGNYTAVKDKKFREAKEVVRQFNLEFVRDVQHIKNHLRIIPADYNPPNYTGSQDNITDLSREKEHFDDSSQVFISESTTALNSIANASKSYDRTDNLTLSPPQANVTGVKTKVTNFEFNFERLTAPGIDFDIWFLKFTSLGDLVFLVDFFFRIYFSIRMCYRYWQVNQVKIPHIDIRTQKEMVNPFQMSNGRIVIHFFTNPVVGALLGSAVLLMTVTAITTVYLPLYSEYRDGCIPVEASGTFISKNIYSSAYNFAYRGGSSSLVKSTDAFEVLKSNTCSSMYIPSASKQAADTGDVATNLRSMLTVGEHMGIFEKCIDIEFIDGMFNRACCNQTGYGICDDYKELSLNTTCPINNLPVPSVPFSPPGMYLFERKSCGILQDNDEWQLNDAIFDCTILPQCDTTCEGPHKNRIRKTTKECSCITEWLLHSLWLRCLLSFTIFAILNISRVGLINGLARVIWKHLHPGTFTVLATCDSTGAIITKDILKKVGEGTHNIEIPSTSAQLSQSIKKKIEWNSLVFRMGGLVIMLGSLSLNIIWIHLVLNAPDATKVQWLL